MAYPTQLQYKTQEVRDAFERIGKLTYPPLKEILGSEKTRHYRNKLEYTFSNMKWLYPHEMDNPPKHMNALGFHVPGKFDKVLHINECHFQDDLSNQIRNSLFDFAVKEELDFFDLRKQEGFLRNLIIRNTSIDEWMVILIVHYKDKELIAKSMNFLEEKFPEITSLNYVVNPKANSTIYDLAVVNWKGTADITEQLGGLRFSIQPKSFFQTNSMQAKVLYDIVKDFAGLSGSELVYDLYCGTGTISLYLAEMAGKVVGIESVEQAIIDANKNAKKNGIENCAFEVGDMRYLLNDEFGSKYGKPDVIVTDPPRSGMHPDVVKQLMKVKAQKIVYVSCKVSTQARDLEQLCQIYDIKEVQPVDMFPHTHHVENVVLLELKQEENS